jgi:SAM-dependent methyltransferase
LDRFLQSWRIRQALPWIPPQSRLLDVGCADGELFDAVGPRLSSGLGIDPHAPDRQGKNWRLARVSAGNYLTNADETFDAITFLASAEHLSSGERTWHACRRLLSPGGRMVLTFPAPLVDAIVALLIFLRVADGMDFEQHAGLTFGEVKKEILAAGFELEHHSLFQLGLNHLAVFRKV